MKEEGWWKKTRMQSRIYCRNRHLRDNKFNKRRKKKWTNNIHTWQISKCNSNLNRMKDSTLNIRRNTMRWLNKINSRKKTKADRTTLTILKCTKTRTMPKTKLSQPSWTISRWPHLRQETNKPMSRQLWTKKKKMLKTNSHNRWESTTPKEQLTMNYNDR